jgi:hypothetical protein
MGELLLPEDWHLKGVGTESYGQKLWALYNVCFHQSGWGPSVLGGYASGAVLDRQRPGCGKFQCIPESFPVLVNSTDWPALCDLIWDGDCSRFRKD